MPVGIPRDPPQFNEIPDTGTEIPETSPIEVKI